MSAQDIIGDSLPISIKQIDKLYQRTEERLDFVEKGVSRETRKMLEKWQKLEQRILRSAGQKELKSVDSIHKSLTDKLERLDKTVNVVDSKVSQLAMTFPNLDELKNSFSFLSTARAKLGDSRALLGRYQQLKTKMAGVQTELEKAALVQQFINERKQSIKERFLNSLPRKQIDLLQTGASRYTAVISDFRQVLKDPGSFDEKILPLLRRIPAFNEFISRNAVLASLLPTDVGVSTLQLSGMQTVALTSQLVQGAAASAGSTGSQMISQKLSQAQEQLNSLLKSKGGQTGEMPLPSQQDQSLKTKRFLNRLELGMNVQFQRPTGYLPQTSEMAFQVGYRFSKSGVAGVGLSYRAGFGQGIRDLRLSHEGIGFRSFLDYRIKKQFHVYGGGELIHQASFNRIEELKDMNAWQYSLLLGLSKRYNVSKKIRGNIMLLYDFLHQQKIPVAQPFQFRFGYNF